MPGINQLPSGAEFAAAISLIWALASWLCSSLLLWLTWAHQEGWSYLALLAASSLLSNTFSIIQQGHDITWYAEVVTTQFERKQTLPGNEPELAISGGSYGMDLVLYYIQYYSYNVQAMLVMFWAAELCQLTYQVGERRKIRQLLRKLHAAGKFVSWLLPLTTVLCLRIPRLQGNFVAFVLVADLPLMISLTIGSGLMIAVTVKYVQSRKKFTQWTPPKFSSTTSAGASDMGIGTQSSSQPLTRTGGKGLYDRWLMVRFIIAFILLAVFEVTNTLFQITALQNNINDAQAAAPDLSAGRAIQTFFLYMPGTTPGIFIYIVFGTTRSSRQKVADLWQQTRGGVKGLFRSPSRKSSPSASPDGLPSYRGERITVEQSLTVTSTARGRALRMYGEENLSESSDIWLKDLTKTSDGTTTTSVQASRMKPLPLPPVSSKTAVQVKTPMSSRPTRAAPVVPISAFSKLSGSEEKSHPEGLSRATTADSLHVLNDHDRLGMEHSDDSGPILPIQRHEARFSRELVINAVRRASGRDRRGRNPSRPNQ